jgi:hypothetical protein
MMGFVARAAAQVAGEGIGDLGTAGLRQRMHQAGQAHDHARRAETALAAMAFDHRLLHRVQGPVFFLQALDGLDRFAVQRRQELQAAVDGQVIDRGSCGIELSDQHHTGAAIALGAALLGAAAPQLLPQVVQNGRRAAFAGGFDNRAVKHEAHSVGRLGHGESGRWKESSILFRRTPAAGRPVGPTRHPTQEPR